MCRFGVALGLVGIVGCVRGLPVEEPAGTEAGPPEPRYVLVAEDAWFYTAPNRHAPRFRDEIEPSVLGDLLGPQYWRLRAGEAVGEFLAVETTDDDAGCLGQPLLEDYRVRLYVERSALVQVLAGPWQVAGPEGTGVKMAAGTPLRRHGDRFEVDAVGVHLRLRLPERLVSDSFAPSPLFDQLQGGSTVPPERPLWLGDEIEVVDHGWFDLAATRQSGPRGVLVVAHRVCTEISAWAPPPPPSHGPPEIRGSLPYMKGSPHDHVDHAVRRGSQVFWPHGSPAGFALEGDVFSAAERVPHPEMACFRRKFGVHADARGTGPVVLCFRPEDLVAGVAAPVWSP